MEETTSSTRRLLFSYAHPDDESFGNAGTIARYVAEGVDVYLICSTNGEAGTVEPSFMEGYESIKDLRLDELQCAAKTLGLKEVFTLGYRDSGMRGSPDNEHPDSLEAADEDDVVRQITKIIRKVRPQVVVTFDPVGGYGHPDHIKMHQTTVKAFKAAPDPKRYPEQIEMGLAPYQPEKLYYSTFNRKILRLLVKILPVFGVDPTKMGRNKDINFFEIAQADSEINTRISNNRYEDIAETARNCHASQLGGLGGSPKIVSWLSRIILGTKDTFTRAYPPVNSKHVRENDLFDDI